MADHRDANSEPGSGQPEQVGRVIVDYGDADQAPEREPSGNQLPIIVLAGIIAIALMIGALLLVLPGVFEM